MTERKHERQPGKKTTIQTLKSKGSRKPLKAKHVSEKENEYTDRERKWLAVNSKFWYSPSSRGTRK